MAPARDQRMIECTSTPANDLFAVFDLGRDAQFAGLNVAAAMEASIGAQFRLAEKTIISAPANENICIDRVERQLERSGLGLLGHPDFRVSHRRSVAVRQKWLPSGHTLRSWHQTVTGTICRYAMRAIFVMRLERKNTTCGRRHMLVAKRHDVEAREKRDALPTRSLEPREYPAN